MSDNKTKGLREDHGKAAFEADHQDARGKAHGRPAHQRGVPREHEVPTRESDWAIGEPVAPQRETTPLVAGQPGIPAGGVDSLKFGRPVPGAAPGRSLFSPENQPAKKRITHFQSKENKAPHHELKHHDRSEDGSDPLHGKVRAHSRPPAPIASELQALETLDATKGERRPKTHYDHTGRRKGQ